MDAAARERILMDLANLQNDGGASLTAGPIEPGDKFHWSAVISGPPNSPYAGGRFSVIIEFLISYPNTPPKVIFNTNIYHPNLHINGLIDLKDWLPHYTISTVLNGIRSLLAEPNFDNGVRSSVYDICKNDRAKYKKTAKTWTKLYARMR